MLPVLGGKRGALAIPMSVEPGWRVFMDELVWKGCSSCVECRRCCAVQRDRSLLLFNLQSSWVVYTNNLLCSLLKLASRLSAAAAHAKLVYSRLAVRSWLGRVLCVYPEQTKCCRGTLGQRV